MLDDFLFIALTKSKCQTYLDAFMALCIDIGVPLAPAKTTLPDTSIVFLGILLNSLARTASLPLGKIQTYSADIEQALLSSKITQQQLQSLVGKLSFAAAVVPARPFLRRLIEKIYTVKRSYQKITISANMKADLQTWLHFLSHYNGVTFFRSLGIIPSNTINLSSDASHQGFGACYGSRWVQAEYPQSWREHHITVLELYPIYVLISMFGHLMKNSTICFICDNSAVVEIIKAQSSKCKTAMKIVRPLTLQLIDHNIHLTSKHIPGKLNVIPDLISRFQIRQEHLRQHKMHLQPTPIPPHLLPRNFTLR